MPDRFRTTDGEPSFLRREHLTAKLDGSPDDLAEGAMRQVEAEIPTWMMDQPGYAAERAKQVQQFRDFFANRKEGQTFWSFNAIERRSGSAGYCLIEGDVVLAAFITSRA